MSQGATIYLKVIRAANRRNLALSPFFIHFLTQFLGLTAQDLGEVAEIIKADIREMSAGSPYYGEINAILQRMSPQNPFGLEFIAADQPASKE